MIIFSGTWLLLCFVIYQIYFYLASFMMFSNLINYLILGIFGIIFGLVYSTIKNKYNNTFEYKLKNSFYTNSIFLPLLLIIPTTIIYLSRATQNLGDGFSTFINISINIWLIPIILNLTFNILEYIYLFKEKQFKKFIYYLIPLGICYLVIIILNLILSIFI